MDHHARRCGRTVPACAAFAGYEALAQRRTMVQTLANLANFIQSDLRGLYLHLRRCLAIVLAVLLVSVLVEFFLSNRLQRVISDPILRQERTASEVAAEKNYSIRASSESLLTIIKGMIDFSKIESGKPLRILVAEDNAVNQKVALHQLRKLGYTADVVANGQEVLATLERIPYDVILMDCQMAEMDGYETTRQIRRREEEYRLPRVRVIALTDCAMEGERERCRTAGMDDFIIKPVRVEELEVVLESGRPARLSSLPPPETSRSASAVSREALQRLRELRTPSHPDPVLEIIDMFLAQTPVYLQSLKAACQAHNSEELRKTAHALKGSCGNLGVEQMAAWCKELESKSRQASFASAESLIARLEREFEAVKTVFEAERSR